MILLFLTRNHAAELFGASQEVTRSVADILPLFLAGFLPAGLTRMLTAFYYATEHNRNASLLIYGEPVCMLVLILLLPRLMGITGTWLAVPLSQLCMMLVSLLMLWRGRHTARLQKAAA